MNGDAGDGGEEMKIALIAVLMAACFALGYCWPRTRYTLDTETMTLCAESWSGKGCAHIQTSGWVPVLEKPER